MYQNEITVKYNKPKVILNPVIIYIKYGYRYQKLPTSIPNQSKNLSSKLEKKRKKKDVQAIPINEHDEGFAGAQQNFHELV